MDREEHLAWCKQRALEYVDSGDLAGALTSMVSDLGKHPDTAKSAVLGQFGMIDVLSGDPGKVRRFIEGFN